VLFPHLNALLGHPHCAVDLEATAKAQLPHTLASLHPAEALHIGQHIPAASQADETGKQRVTLTNCWGGADMLAMLNHRQSLWLQTHSGAAAASIKGLHAMYYFLPEHSPHAGAADIAKAEEASPAGLHLLCTEAEGLLHCVQHSTATCRTAPCTTHVQHGHSPINPPCSCG